MADETENIEPVINPSKILEREKLELEIRQLKQSYFRKSIAPILVQAAIGLTVALISVYLAYKSNLFDVKEKSIDAKTKYDETLLKTIELTQKRQELNDEVKSFKIIKERLLLDSIKISFRLDSMIQGLSIIQNEKYLLQNNIAKLNSNKKALVKELGFATINHNLQELKKFPDPNYKLTIDLVDVLKSGNKFRQRTIDSLILYSKDDSIKYISFFILYKGTSNAFFKDKLFSQIPNILNFLKGRNCMEHNFKHLLSTHLWTTDEKNELIKILLKNYKNEMSYCGKLDVLSIIYEYGFDQSFSFVRSNYNLYWDYLKMNRDLFTSSDTLIYGQDRYYTLENIKMYSPQLYYSLWVKYLGKVKDKDFVNSSTSYALIKSATSYLPAHKQNDFDDFADANRLLDAKTQDPVEFCVQYYKNNKLKIDPWLYGNFEVFRRDTTKTFNCIKYKTF